MEKSVLFYECELVGGERVASAEEMPRCKEREREMVKHEGGIEEWEGRKETRGGETGAEEEARKSSSYRDSRATVSTVLYYRVSRKLSSKLKKLIKARDTGAGSSAW